MGIPNPFSWVSGKIDNALNKSVNQASVSGLGPHTREALEILHADATVSDDDIATVLNLSPDIAEPFIKHARRIILKEQLTRPLPVPVDSTTNVVPQDTATNITTGRWIEGGDQREDIPEIALRMEEHRQTAQKFVEDKKSWHKTLVKLIVQAACYLVPITLAIMVGLVIGEQYSTNAGQSTFYAPFSYTVGIGVELMLWGLSFAASVVLKRMFADHKNIGPFVALCTAFLLFSIMSILAQWLVYEAHFHNPDFPTTVGIFFRSGATTCSDISALLVLAVIDFEDFKAHLKKQREVAEHVRDLSRVEVEGLQIRQEEIRRQKEAAIDSERKMRQAQFFSDMEQKQIDQMKRGDREDRGRW
jgi:hypothetical protein